MLSASTCLVAIAASATVAMSLAMMGVPVLVSSELFLETRLRVCRRPDVMFDVKLNVGSVVL